MIYYDREVQKLYTYNFTINKYGIYTFSNTYTYTIIMSINIMKYKYNDSLFHYITRLNSLPVLDD